jgi:putative copper resistance protein D
MVGCAVLVVATWLPSSSFTGHMAEHVMVGMVAPLLLALGAPVTLVLQASGAAARRAVRSLLHSSAVRIATQPLVAWTLFGTTLVALVFSPLLEWSVRHDAVHALVHAHFLLVGSLFAATFLAIDPLPRPLPHGARLLAVLLAVPFHAIVGMALFTASRPLSPSVYPSLDDQRSAAAVLWSSGELLTLAMAAIVFRRWWAAEQRAAARLDRQLGAAPPGR